VRRFVLSACLIAILGPATLAAQEPAQSPEPDPRLDEKVTIKAIGKPLGDFLKELTAQTGVKLSASRHAADIKVAVFVKGVPLSSLKDALKDCLHLQCTREGRQDEWTYRFWEDMKTRLAADGIRQERVRKLRAYIERLRKQMDEIEAEGKDPAALAMEFARWTPEQKEKLCHEDPDRYEAYLQFGTAGPLAVLTAYSTLNRAQLQALWAGGEVIVFADAMSPGLRERFNSRAADWSNRLRLESSSWNTAIREGPARPSVRRWVSPDTELPTADCLVLSVRDGEWDNRPVLDYGFGVAADAGQRPGYVFGSSSIAMPNEAVEVEPPDEGGSHSGPDLKLKIPPRATAYEVMEQVFELTGACIVSDYFTRVKQRGIITGILTGEHASLKTADDVLKQVAKDIKSDFSTSGGIGLLVSRSWPSDRAREIPERLLARWRAARKKYGGARIEEAIEMANLSKLQLEDLEMYKTGYGGAIIRHKAAIRAAGSLTAGQWQAAMSETGLSTSTMSPAQLALIQEWVREQEQGKIARELTDELRDPGRLRSCVLKIRYKGSGEKDDNIKATYEFELYPPSYYEAIGSAAREASARGEQAFAVPSRGCRGYIRLADLNQHWGWPPPDDKSAAG